MARTGHQKRSVSDLPTSWNIDGMRMGTGTLSGRSFLAKNPGNVLMCMTVPPPSVEREIAPGALLKACISLDREPHARAKMKESLQTKISSGMFLSDLPSAEVNGGLRSCHKTRLMSNLGRTRSFLGRLISKFF